LLTEPPEPDHAEIAVRYLPAAEAARVGGDWYDAFLQPGGTTMLVIGDVVGHDTEAAAAMGQLRGLLRGIATYSDAGPVEVLRGLDASMRTLQTKTLATAAVARFEQTPDELERGVTRMRWANAGHLPPLIINPDGSLAELATWRGDLLLGVDAEARRRESVVTLDRGSTVLLYTDGLIERRDSDLDHGLVRLRDALADLVDLPLDELLDELIERLVHGRPDDDVAIVAVRLHRQDRRRPAEAGPNDVPPDVPPERTPS
jgi:serine phosphatase RsbU (regulator of sigma subunit)